MATTAVANSTNRLVASTLPKVLAPVGLQVYNAHPVWRRIAQSKSQRPWEGESIQGAVQTSKYGKARSYSGDDVIPTTMVSPFTAFQFEQGGYIVDITLPMQDVRKNESAPEKVFSIVKQWTKSAMLDMVDEMTTDLLQASKDAKGINTLYEIADASTTIAGIAGGSTWGGTTTISSSFSLQGKSDVVTLWSTLSGNASFDENAKGDESGYQDAPDVSFVTPAIWQYYWQSLEGNIRYTSGSEADVKLVLRCMGHPVIADNHVPTGVWYMLRSSELYLYVAKSADFTLLDEVRSPQQPDVSSRAAIWNGQLVFNNRRHQGKLVSITA